MADPVVLFSTDTVGTMNGFFKRRFADKLVNNVPTQTKIQSDISFNQSAKLGDDYQQTVELQLEHGITYAGSTDDAFLLNDSVASATKPARIQGSQHVLKTQIGYKAAAAAQTGEQAFANIVRSRVRNMWFSMHKRLEIDLIHGGCETGLGQDDTAASTTSFTFNVATWAPGIWAGMTGAYVQVYDAAGANPGDAPTSVLGTAGASVQITAVDIANRKLTFGALGAAGTAPRFIAFGAPGINNSGQINATPVWMTMKGLDVIARQTTGTLFNIAPTTDTWQGNNISANSGDLSFGIWNDAVATALGKGADGDFIGYIAPITWGNLMTDQGALRRYDVSQNTSTYQVGAKDIEFYSQNGKLTIRSHTMVKQGQAFAYQPGDFMRIGATDITFDRANMPGVTGAAGSFFREIDAKAGFELRAYSDQALFTEAPSHVITITSIVNS